MDVLRSTQYDTDLLNIIRYIGARDAAAAVRLWDEVESQVERLADFPMLGRLGRLVGTRELVIGRTPYVVIYSTNGIVVLLRVLHGAQQWPRRAGDTLNG